MTAPLRLCDAEILGAGVGDVWVRDGVIVSGPVRGAREIDCAGAALLPGLHDHHIHLMATAAAAESVSCGAPEVSSPAELAARLTSASPRGGWVRGIGYDDSVAGELDAAAMDRIGCTWPVRVQHRSGALWILNTLAIEELALEDVQLDGIERDGAGRATGRLWRMDGWLRERLGTMPAPDLADLSARLSSYGITGVTDATPDLSDPDAAALASAGVRQHLTLLGVRHPTAPCGAFKIVLGDHELPDWDDLVSRISTVRPRAVALHSVTRASLLLALAVLAEVGAAPGDRIEHAAVAPPEAIAALASLGLTVVTQPSLVRRRGASYLDQVDDADQPWLWPFRSLLDAGVRVGLSSDAPYGDLDPWASIAAAVSRETSDGRVLVESERVSARQALHGYLTAANDPGGPERRIAPGAPADLALIDRRLVEALASPEQVRVRMTIIDGEIVHEAMT